MTPIARRLTTDRRSIRLYAALPLPKPREREDAERAAGGAAEMAADRDARHGEGEREVDDQQGQRAAAEHVGSLALEHDRGAEDPVNRAGRADGDAGRGSRAARLPSRRGRRRGRAGGTARTRDRPRAAGRSTTAPACSGRGGWGRSGGMRRVNRRHQSPWRPEIWPLEATPLMTSAPCSKIQPPVGVDRRRHPRAGADRCRR